MRSLDQIDAKLEKRTPISSAPYPISQPGSYYLTGNVTATTGDAITVASNGVTIDLNGFTISSTSPTASGTAILLGNNIHDVTIRNGHIVSGTTVNGSNFSNGPGFVHGIRYTTNSVYNVLISDVTVSGCNSSGIDLAFGQTVVESCTVSVAGGYGITASTIRNCTAANIGLTAIYSNTVSGSSGSQVGPTNYYGVFGQSVINCYGISSAGFGIYGYSVLNSYGQTSTGTYGILGETIVGFY